MSARSFSLYEEQVIGHAEVRQIFRASGLGVIAGSYVLDGKIVRGCSARITRDGEKIFEGALALIPARSAYQVPSVPPG